ncbi:MAG TPA: FG-GAP-like repeat-containing protein [Bacteroidia bacterium]|nr:FG-GAP-like repeat-containing protein [Bacteroidia bacterium]
MKKVLLSILTMTILQHVSFAQQSCLTAQVITAGVYGMTTISGTDVPPTICPTGANTATAARWYKYTPSQAFNITVTSDFPSNGLVDNRVNIYSGSCGALVCVTGDDDSGNNALCVANFTCVANTDYFIVFDNVWSSNGFMFELIEDTIVAPNPDIVTFSSVPLTNIIGTAMAAVDMNGDYLDDLVAVNTTNIQIREQDINGTLTTVNYSTPTAANSPSWSLAVGDLNNDGYNDLLYGGGSGVTFMKSNGLGTGYTESSGSEYVFSQRSNFVDMNNDGNLDAFVCHDVAPNVYYINDGSGNLTFNQGGVGDHPNGGNYGSIWVDYNNDHLPDLFIAKCRGGAGTAKINELHKNNGDGTFTNVSNGTNMADPIQTWSSAWNDYDNDGWMDVVVGASSNADGMHKFMHNNGDGTFTDITAGSGIDTYPGMSIEYVSYDFNNDGFADVLTNNNILFNNGNNTFTTYPYSLSVGAVGDLNNDGFLDVINGSTIRYNSGNSNNWLTVSVQGTTSNRNGIGARVEIYGSWGKQIRDVRSGIGFRYMGSLNVHFGIGSATQIDSVIVRWPSGNVDLVCNPEKNNVLHIVENSGITPTASFTANVTSINEFESVDFTDASTPCPSSWSWTVTPATGWSFSNGTTANSQNPSITFTVAGSYLVSLTSNNGNGASTNVSNETILVNSTAGINDNSLSNIILFPNPANNFLHLKLNQNQVKSIAINSILGAQVESNYNKTNNTIDISNLAAGTYFISITTVNNVIVTKRFVKK